MRGVFVARLVGCALIAVGLSAQAASPPPAKLPDGVNAQRDIEFAKANPITYITKEDPPFLVAHGEKDNAVPFNQSELLVDALRKGGVDVTFEAIKGGGHNFGPTQYQRLVPIVLAFFDKHLKGASTN
jgi:dipeptidyl aminopeptidase/acylaminoacyl peptidase